MTSEICKLENDLCRCCLSKGVFINLAEPCKHLEEKETYADMLRDSLDVHITPVLGELSTVTFTICDSCASQLHSAVKFKKQVLISEERFKDMYSKNFINVADSTLPPQVKLELRDETDDDYEEDFTQMDFDNDDTIIDIKLENTKKVRAKKPKVKSKTKKAGKKVGKAKKGKDTPKVEAEAEADEADVKTEDAEKRGNNRRAKYYTITQGSYTCDICGRKFASQPLVSQHYRFVHLKRHRNKERKCPHCDTKVPGYLRAYHLEEVHGIPAPKCGICDKKFRFPCHVLQHQKKVHMGEKTAQCDLCNKSFFNNISLRLHMSTHSDERRFRCDVCERVFRWENNLKDHLKIHLGDKRYGCSVCGKAFVQKSTLKQHAIRNHPGIDVF